MDIGVFAPSFQSHSLLFINLKIKKKSSINGVMVQVAGYWNCEVFSFVLSSHPQDVLCVLLKDLVARAKVRLYKPADEPRKSQRGAGARLLKVVSY